VQQTAADWGGSAKESLNTKLAMQMQIVDEKDRKPDQQGASLSCGLDFRLLAVEPHLRRSRRRRFNAGSAAVNPSLCVKRKEEHHSCGERYQQHSPLFSM
jgi:hypothetical protein